MELGRRFSFQASSVLTWDFWGSSACWAFSAGHLSLVPTLGLAAMM